MATQDVLIGPGRLYRAPVGEAFPDETTVAYGAVWGGNWTDMGDFPEDMPVTITIDETVVKVYGQQSSGVKKQSRTRREPVVKGALLEHSIANMALMLDGTAAATAAGASQKGFSSIPFGVNPDVDEYAWGVEALRKDATGANQPVRWLLHKGSIRLAGDIVYDKTKETVIPFEITILEDDSQDAGEELGEFQQVTAAATA